MIVAIGIALFFAAQFAGIGAGATQSEADLAWQRWLGETILRTHHLPHALGSETFSAVGARWVPQEWFFSIVVALAMRAHLFALLAMGVAAGSALALLLAGALARRRGASQPATWLALFLCGIAMEQLFGVRAQVAVWPLAAAYLFLLDLDDARAFAAIAIAVLWANVHASAMLAPVLATLRTAADGLDVGPSDARTRRTATIAAGSALAMFATPFGFALPQYALRLLSSPIRGAILEWRAPHLTDLSFAFGVLPLALATLGIGLASRRLRRGDALFALAIFAFALLAARNLALAAIALAPLCARALTPLLPDDLRIVSLVRERGTAAVLAVAIAVGGAAVAARANALVAATGTRLPTAFVRDAARLPGIRHLYCEDFAWCSLALANPRVRTFLDGRCDPFPSAVWRDYLAIARDRRMRSRLLERDRIDTVLARSRGPLERSLREGGRWRVVAVSARYTLFARE